MELDEGQGLAFAHTAFWLVKAWLLFRNGLQAANPPCSLTAACAAVTGDVMDLPQGLFPASWLIAGVLAYALLVIWAATGLNWRRLRRLPHKQHAFFAGSTAVTLLWLADNGLLPGAGGHLLGMTALTLLLGWRQAMVGSLFPVICATLVGVEPWSTAGLAGLLLAALPIGITHLLWRISSYTLPRSLFVYLGVCVFCGSILTVVLPRAAISGMLASTGIYTFEVIRREYLSLLPMALLLEAVVNLTVIATLALLRPDWLLSLQQRYLSR